MGHYTFGIAAQPPLWLRAHEYIHTLEYQADAAGFLTYLQDAISGVKTGPAYFPRESIAYLWAGWIRAYGLWEKEPWQIWVPLR